MEIVHHSNSPGAEGFRPLLLCGTAGKTLAQLRARKTQSCGKVPAIWDCSGRLPEALSHCPSLGNGWLDNPGADSVIEPVRHAVIHSLDHWLRKTFIHSFILSFILYFIHSVTHSVIHLCIHLLTHPRRRWLTWSFAYSLIASLVHSFTHPPIHSFIRLFSQSIIRWFIKTSIPGDLLLVPLIHYYFIHLFTTVIYFSFLHWFLHVIDFVCLHAISFGISRIICSFVAAP